MTKVNLWRAILVFWLPFILAPSAFTASAPSGLQIPADAYVRTDEDRKYFLRDVMIAMPRPDYPYIARRNHWTGAGIFLAHLSRRGIVTSVRITKSTGYHILDNAVVFALHHWMFKPQTVSGELRIPVSFTMPPTARRRATGNGEVRLIHGFPW
jgi:TonB family protein